MRRRCAFWDWEKLANDCKAGKTILRPTLGNFKGLKAEDLPEPVRQAIQWPGDLWSDGAEDAPEDDHRDAHDADEQFAEPPGDEDGTEEDFEEGFHGDRWWEAEWMG